MKDFMNSQVPAGTEYQVTITDGGRVKLIESDGGKGVTVKRTIGEWTPDELAEVIARNVQPSPELADVLKELDYRGIRFDAELAKEGTAWECAAEPEPQYFETLREALDFLFSLVEKEARPVPQPATEPDENAKLQAFAQSRHGDMDSFYEGWDAALALRDVPQGATKEMLAQAIIRGAQLEAAIKWALGEGEEDFPARPIGQGAYWWRTKLREMAQVPVSSARKEEDGG